VAVQLRLMGNPDEVAAIMAALTSGKPVTVLTNGSPVPNRDSADVRMFGMVALPGHQSTPDTTPARRVRSQRADPGRRRIGR
jgi:hypothetical protein